MGFIRRLDANVDIQTFPGAKFETAGQVPAPQCSEAKIEGTGEYTSDIPNELVHTGAFVGYDLAGKVCTITENPGGEIGDFDITSNTDDNLILVQWPGLGLNPVYYIHDGGELILTRDVHSFAEYIHAAGYAFTIKGGKLYTNMPSGQLKNACTILFDPIT